MVCPYCDGTTKVANSRPQKRNNQIWRRRQCLRCKAIFTTHEILELGDVFFVRSNDIPVPLLRAQLINNVLQVLQHRSDPYSDSYEITDTVIKQLFKHPDKPVFTPQQISLEVSKVLKRFDKQAWLKFVAEHPSLHS